jgi:hypothetical protein
LLVVFANLFIVFSFDVKFVEFLKGEFSLADFTAEDEVVVATVVLHVVLEVVVARREVLRVVSHVAGRAQAVSVRAVVAVFDDLKF